MMMKKKTKKKKEEEEEEEEEEKKKKKKKKKKKFLWTICDRDADLKDYKTALLYSGKKSSFPSFYAC